MLSDDGRQKIRDMVAEIAQAMGKVEGGYVMIDPDGLEDIAFSPAGSAFILESEIKWIRESLITKDDLLALEAKLVENMKRIEGRINSLRKLIWGGLAAFGVALVSILVLIIIYV
jgi:hypothetical protein